MNITFKNIVDPNEWNSFVKELPRYSFVQSFEYTLVVNTLVNEMRHVGVYLENELVALLPIGVIKAKRGNYLRLRHGPILSKKSENPEIIKEIFLHLRKIAKAEGLSFIRIQPILESTELLKQAGFRTAPSHNLDAEHTLQLNLLEIKGGDPQKTEENVMKNMRKNTRYYIRKAFKEGVFIKKDNADFDSLYRILKETSTRQNYTTWPKAYFENLFSQFGNDQLNLYFAEVNGEKIGIGLFLDFGKYRFYLEGGMNMEFSNYYPAYAIQWTSIKDAIHKGVEIYDFWGGVAPKDNNGNQIKNYPWAGINMFKAGFGGKEISMVHPHDDILSNKYWITWFIESIERKKRGY